MGITKKERFLKAHFELAKMYIYDRKTACPLCRISEGRYKTKKKAFIYNCALCTQGKKLEFVVESCFSMNTYKLYFNSARKKYDEVAEYRKLRARYHIEAIKILRKIPKERFTKAGHVGFLELFELDGRLYKEYLRNKK